MIIRINILPSGVKAMNLFGVIVTRKTTKLDESTINHERIHTKQIWEMLGLPFYFWYLVEYLIKLIKFRNRDKAYRSISFEREAYTYQHDLDYLSNRKWYAWFKHL